MSLWIIPADLQAWLGPAIDDDAALVLATAASDSVKAYIERDVSLQTVSETLDSNNTDHVLVSFWPIQSVITVTVNGGQPLPVAAFNQQGYLLDPLVRRMIRFPGWRIPRGVSNIAVNYTAGYDFSQPPGSPTGPPADFYTALKLTAAAISNAQAADPNLASESTAGVFSGSFYSTGAGAVPPGARSLLQSYKRVS